jgi:competence protein ComEA
MLAVAAGFVPVAYRPSTSTQQEAIMRYLYSLLMSVLMLFAVQAHAGPVDINHADAGTLATAIVGIGEKKAAMIVQDRAANGPFASVDELARVKGIGAATIEKNRGNLTVGTPAD